jgi:hypothetical protein
VTNPLSEDYRDGYDEGWRAGYLQGHTELVAIVSGEGSYTPTERAGVQKALRAAVAQVETSRGLMNP